ncbi:hypothetical protein ONZ45_g12608 [Pleurotus djamor]|nr:hypothetical protein ONZ45_g12608 [Pleurotus djamor]
MVDRLKRPTRLFDTETRCFITDVDWCTKYAILSHRWDEENELTFNQLLNYGSCPTSNQKFEKFCEVARTKYECRYVWMDSACINRDDATELETSIQSMYWWYKSAHVCIVYLADACDSESFPSSSWFTRGWTLQELLAPRRMAFYYRDWTRVSQLNFDVDRDSGPWLWTPISNKETNDHANGVVRKSLRESIAEAAGVDREFLDVTFTPSTSRLGDVLMWARNRYTSRPEDAAYSLVSLLNVCLPPHYGEGEDRALDRLRHACGRNYISLVPALHLPTDGFVLLQNPLKSQFCRHHQAIQGQPTILHLKTRSLLMTYILFTSLPLPSPQNIQEFAGIKSIDGPQQGYIRTRHFAKTTTAHVNTNVLAIYQP